MDTCEISHESMQFTLYQRLLVNTPEDGLLDRNMSCVTGDNIQINILNVCCAVPTSLFLQFY
jgi:hypothetical protein